MKELVRRVGEGVGGPILSRKCLIDPMFSFQIRGDLLVEKELCGDENGMVGDMNTSTQ